MCDHSLQNVKLRAAKVDDKLTTRNFGTQGSHLLRLQSSRPRRDLELAGSTRSHLICAARLSISHRLYKSAAKLGP
jgi:hypothetical protein